IFGMLPRSKQRSNLCGFGVEDKAASFFLQGMLLFYLRGNYMNLIELNQKEISNVVGGSDCCCDMRWGVAVDGCFLSKEECKDICFNMWRKEVVALDQLELQGMCPA
ncbi:MAG: hypothetical protein KKE11_06195, partial [Gammaproteobacteria bacterium]|nr:hypothetical protein [Gammaproteobacteria bacterium]